MKTIKSRKGSVIVLLMIFFVTIVSMIYIFTDSAKRKAVDSSSEALGNLWANSVLAEYDLNLQKRYCLFGFYGMPGDIRKKIDFYAGISFKNKKYIDYEVSGCSLYDFSLCNPSIVKKQIVKAGKLAAASKLIKPSLPQKKDDEEIEKEGVIKNEVILSQLPSKGSKKGFCIDKISNIMMSGKEWKHSIKYVGDSAFIDAYISNYFKNSRDSRSLGRTFYRNEEEYIICGRKSDSENAAEIRKIIIAAREGPNLLFLEKDSTKKAAAAAAAEMITPGPAAAATTQLLLAAWAFAESVNDYNLLLNGYKVQALKTDETWAVDLDAVVNNSTGGCVYTGNNVGNTYEDYISLMIAFTDNDTKILRIMDLIQINMKYLYYSDFLLKDYNAGLNYTLKINGRIHEFERAY